MARRNNPDQVFTQLGTIALGEQPLSQILERVVHLASEMLPATVEASLTILTEDQPSTLASTGEACNRPRRATVRGRIWPVS